MALDLKSYKEVKKIFTAYLENKELRNALADVKVLYVPLQSTGCVFQALQMQEQVRKNR